MYHPYIEGYSVLPGLRPLGYDFGNGELDSLYFQEDENLGYYRQVKMDAIDNGQVAVLTEARDGAVWNRKAQDYVRDWMVAKLQEEYPESDFVDNPPQTLDAIGLRIQEDFAVHVRDDKEDWLAYTNICLPSNWYPENNIGKSFLDVHKVVPGMALNKSEGIVKVMMEKGPFVRFVWTVVFENKLNYHPDLPRKNFDPDNPTVLVKVERQITIPMPEISGMLFLIRVYLLPLNEVEVKPLISSLKSMTPEQKKYKSIDEDYENLIEYLSGLEASK